MEELRHRKVKSLLAQGTRKQQRVWPGTWTQGAVFQNGAQAPGRTAAFAQSAAQSLEGSCLIDAL